MLKPALILSLILAAGMVRAADPVTDAMQQAYPPYRVALSQTNKNAQGESRQAVAQAQRGWNQIAIQFSANPPGPYDRDPGFSGSLAKVSQIYAKAADEIEKNQLTTAHETLEGARDAMAEMRQRNQVIVYSDIMNAYHAQMEHVLIEGEKTLAAPNGLLQLTAQVGALEYLAGTLKSAAPPEYLKNDEFNSVYKAVDKSVSELKAALFLQDVAKVKEAMGKIKGPYSKMFIKFG